MTVIPGIRGATGTLPTHWTLQQSRHKVTRGKERLAASAMPPKARKKLGYNWRARQGGHGVGNSRLSSVARKVKGVEVCGPSEDSNALVLPSRAKVQVGEAESRTSKRKRLSARQRKRLTRVLEIKEKKKMVCSY